MQLPDDTVNVAALIGSRICHDLISPVGAISNGLELLEMTGIGGSPELSLVSSSATEASSRIRMFRIAFGRASEQQKTSEIELRSIFTDCYSDGRVIISWIHTGDLPRKIAKALVLAVLCVEQSIPFGGEIQIKEMNDIWVVRGLSNRIAKRPDLWEGLMGQARFNNLSPADVQFLLLKETLDTLERKCSVVASDKDVCLRF